MTRPEIGRMPSSGPVDRPDVLNPDTAADVRARASEMWRQVLDDTAATPGAAFFPAWSGISPQRLGSDMSSLPNAATTHAGACKHSHSGVSTGSPKISPSI